MVFPDPNLDGYKCVVVVMAEIVGNFLHGEKCIGENSQPGYYVPLPVDDRELIIHEIGTFGCE